MRKVIFKQETMYDSYGSWIFVKFTEREIMEINSLYGKKSQ